MAWLAKIPSSVWVFVGSLNIVTISVGVWIGDLSLTLLGLFNILCCGISYQLVEKMREDEKNG